jgi:hypothetical protein
VRATVEVVREQVRYQCRQNLRGGRVFVDEGRNAERRQRADLIG